MLIKKHRWTLNQVKRTWRSVLCPLITSKCARIKECHPTLDRQHKFRPKTSDWSGPAGARACKPNLFNILNPGQSACLRSMDKKADKALEVAAKGIDRSNVCSYRINEQKNLTLCSCISQPKFQWLKRCHVTSTASFSIEKVSNLNNK